MGRSGRSLLGPAGEIFVFTAPAKFSVEGQVNHAEGVEGGEQYPGEQQPESQAAYPIIHRPTSIPGSRQDLILAPEAGQGDNSHQAHRTDEHYTIGPGHPGAQAAHVAHIKGAGGVVDTARPQE